MQDNWEEKMKKDYEEFKATPTKEDLQKQRIFLFIQKNIWKMIFSALALAIAIATIFSFVLGYGGAALFDAARTFFFGG